MEVGKRSNDEDPWIRVKTFGIFSVESRIGEEGLCADYARVNIEQWPRRGYVLPLFKVLLCQPWRYAPRDQLLETFWPERPMKQAGKYLDEVAYNLRLVLRGPEGESLLRTVPGSNGSGYQLADQRLLWIDADGFETIINQALLSHNTPESLSLWKAAHEFVTGVFLPDDLWSAWSNTRREELIGKAGQCVYKLADLFIETNQSNLALDVLWGWVISHPEDEDALYRLLILFEHLERYRAAWDRYLAMKERLTQVGKALSPRMHALARRVRAKLNETLSDTAVESMPSIVMPLIALSETNFLGETGLLLSDPSRHKAPGAPGAESASFSEHLAGIITLIYQWRSTHSCEQLQRLLEQEFTKMVDIEWTDGKDSTRLTRREALPVIAALPGAFLASVKQPHRGQLLPEAFLPQCAASLSANWYLLTGSDGLVTVARELPKYLPYLLSLAKQPSKYQREASYLASQGCLLMGLIALHHLIVPKNFEARVQYCREAVSFAKESGNMTLIVAALTHLANASFDMGDLTAMIHYHQEAAQCAAQPENRVPRLLQSKTLSGLAHAHAQHGQVQAALTSIGKAYEVFPEADEAVVTPAFLSTDYGKFSLILFTGIVRRDLATHEAQGGHQQEAEKALAQIEAVPLNTIPARFDVEITLERARVSLGVRNREEFERYFLKGIEGVKALNSEKRRQEAAQVYKEARGVWANDQTIRGLADRLIL